MHWVELATGAGAGASLMLAALRVLKRGRGLPTNEVLEERRADIASRLAGCKHVIESAGMGTFFWDVVHDTVRWSKHHYAIFGVPESTSVTHAMFRQRIHPDDLAAVDAAIDTAVRGGADYAVRFRLCLDDASVRYVRGSGRVELDSEGKPVSVHGAVVDITEATQAHNVVQQRERDLAAVATHLPDIIGRFDHDHRCVFMSARGEALAGQPAEFYVGKKVSEFGLPYLLAARWEAVLDSVQRNGQVREFDFSHVDAAGKERFFITRALPSFDPEGKVESILTVSSDHTERERGARQMREAGAALERADLRKNEYLATLAHELRGPLAPISSATQLIRFSKDRGVRDKAREVIERQVGQLAQLINDLMEVGRISSGKLDIDKKRVALQDVIAQSVESTRPLFDHKKQALTSSLPPLPIWLDGDALRLSQVFSNLLTNASKYSPAGARVAIEARMGDGAAVIDVRDDGVGLSAASMDEIFDLFVQVHATGVQAQGGLGIGLNLVRQLVELHGGKVSVSSEGIGKGSCFTVVLPCMDQGAPAVDAAPAPQPFTARSLTVLVVDDNVDGATTLGMLLEALGHTAVLAFNGLDAVACVEERPLDMAFVDLGLPDISGVQVALRIRGMPQGRKLPLIALTGLGRDEDRYMTRAAQFNEHITKPLQIDDLTRIIQTIATDAQVAP